MSAEKVVVIPSREYITEVTFDDIVKDIESDVGRDSYSFFYILQGSDRSTFIRELKKYPQLHLEIYKRKAIRLYDWVDIMQKIEQQLAHYYVFYRKAYAGENAGKEQITRTVSKHVVEVFAFAQESKLSTTLLESLWFGSRQDYIEVLLYNCRMTIMDRANVHRSAWSHPTLVLNNMFYA
jgi:hypothetical protein